LRRVACFNEDSEHISQSLARRHPPQATNFTERIEMSDSTAISIGKRKKLSIRAVISFLIASAVCAAIIGVIMVNRINIENLTMQQFILEKSLKINEIISKMLYKTHILATIIAQNKGKIENFERLAVTIIDDPAILNILVAPGGVVSEVYPLRGNENVIGLHFFTEGKGNKEAILAKEKGELVFGGPFTLVQGGQGLVGRLPVFQDMPDGDRQFWGLVAITLKYPQILNGVGLDTLTNLGFTYELWRINPDDNKKQIIATNGGDKAERGRYLEKHIAIFNADWYFRVSPGREWYEYHEVWLMILTGLFVSFMIASIIQKNVDLKIAGSELEEMARTDVLTGVYNRRYFMELASWQIEKMKRAQKNCFVIIFDLDYFKIVNDTYGHIAGDKVLQSVASSVKKCIRLYDLLARYGGEEFIMLVTDSDNTGIDIANLAERYRRSIADTHIDLEDMRISVTASFGISNIAPDNDLDKAIQRADEALYRAKQKGRNRFVLYKSGG
jgi:diguanylate cyclase (GGDEF)-like protein